MTKQTLELAKTISENIDNLESHLVGVDQAIDIIENHSVEKRQDQPYNHTYTTEDSILLASFEAYHTDVRKFQFWMINEFISPIEFFLAYRLRIEEKIKSLKTQLEIL